MNAQPSTSPLALAPISLIVLPPVDPPVDPLPPWCGEDMYPKTVVFDVLPVCVKWVRPKR